MMPTSSVTALVIAAALASAACDAAPPTASFARANPRPLDPALVAQGKEIFRHNTFGNEVFWTDTARMHEVISGAVSPAVALSVGLQVDAEALPQSLKDAIGAGHVNLNDPATTVALLKLDAVLGLHGTVRTVNGRDTLVAVGITCALCHSRWTTRSPRASGGAWTGGRRATSTSAQSWRYLRPFPPRSRRSCAAGVPDDTTLASTAMD